MHTLHKYWKYVQYLSISAIEMCFQPEIEKSTLFCMFLRAAASGISKVQY